MDDQDEKANHANQHLHESGKKKTPKLMATTGTVELGEDVHRYRQGSVKLIITREWVAQRALVQPRHLTHPGRASGPADAGQNPTGANLTSTVHQNNEAAAVSKGGHEAQTNRQGWPLCHPCSRRTQGPLASSAGGTASRQLAPGLGDCATPSPAKTDGPSHQTSACFLPVDRGVRTVV